ncbi:MAG: tetratricopeptide repeat protein, partial [Deltaproteobacteria bacterium]|nr:tetratricopeptide repeat protein [Deltaproteobacteria bacterium]
DRAAAARDFEACLVLDPRCPEALAALESYYRDSGDWDALRLLYLQGLEGVTGQALAAGGEKLERTIDVLVSLAELEVAPLGHPERAIVHLKRALSLKPGDVGLLRRLADAAGRGRQWREKVEALETLARQVRDAGERANLYLEIAAIYRDHLGGGGVVLENTMVAFVCDNANRRAFEELERLYAAERRWREMIGIYDVALGTFPQGGPYQRDYLLKRKGLVLARAMDAPREASEVLLAALAISPEDSEVVGALELLLAQSHDAAHRLRMLEILADNREGVSRMELLLRAAEVSASLPGREKTNETYYRQALQAMPGVDERPVRALETIYRQSQRWEELLGLYDEVIRRSSEPGQRRFFLLRRAELLEAEQRDLGRAAAAYQQLLEEQEEDLEALAALARLYEASRSWDELLAVSRRQLARTRVPRDRGLLLFRIGSILETHRNDENGAEEAYRAALGEDPRCFPALHGLRDLYLRRQSWSRAVETLELEAGLWEDPRDQAAVLVRLGDLLHQRLAERKRAVAAYQQALRIAPGFPAAVRALLPLLIEIESWEEAGPLARQATRLAAVGAQADPATRLMALSQRALVALRLGELGEAAAALQLALQIDPQYFPALEVLRELALQPRCQQLPGETLQGLLAAVERSPAGAASAGLWLPVLRGRVAEARFEIEDALRQYRVASRAVPGSLEVCRPLISLLVRLRRWPEAADLLTALAEQAVERLDWAQTLLRQGQILMDRLDDAETAAACFARVIEELGSLRAADSEEGYGVGEERSWRVALFLGAQAAYLLQRWQEGSALLRRLVEAESEDPRNLHGPASLGLYHYYLGRFLRDGLDRTDEAAASFYQAIQEGPGLVEPVLALARQLWREGDRAELEELLDGQIALARTQSGPEAPLRLRYLLAQCRMRSGDSAAALSLLERAIREGEDPAMARRSLARLALAAGQVERAGEALRDVLLCGGSVVQTLKELVGIWEEQNDRPRLACLRPLLIAATGRSEVAPPPAGPGDLAAHPLPADLLRKNAVHPHARGLLFELWPELVHQLALQPGQERPPLEPLGTEHELIRACAEHLAARLGLPAPPLARLGQLGRPVAVLGDTLLIDAELARLQDAGALTFWLAGALFLKQAGLALAAHPRPEVAQQASRACAAVVVEAAGLAVPARWSLQPAPRCAVESAERALAAARQHSTAHSSIALPDPSRFLEGLELTCHRVGLLAVNDPAVALRELRRVQPGHPGGEVPRGEPRAILELIHYAVGGDHLEVCTQLGLAPSAHDARFEGRATKGGKPTMNEDDA